MTTDIYRVHPVSDHVTLIEEALDNPGFMTLVTGEDSALLFDTGYGSGDLVSLVGGLTELPVTVVLSHGHFDHACAAWQFAEAWLHPADHDSCMSGTSREVRAERWGRNTRHREAPPDIARTVSFEEYTAHTCCPLKPLAYHQVFDLGGVTCEVIPMPGHTKGSVGLLIREERILLAGDGANPTFFLQVPQSATWEDHKETLRGVLDLPFDRFIIGHRATLFPKESIRNFLKAAEKADPGRDRIRIGANPDRIVFRSQYLPESDPDACYMLYREDQIPGVIKSDVPKATVIFGANTPEGLKAVRSALGKERMVYALYLRGVPDDLDEEAVRADGRVRLLEEVNVSDDRLVKEALQTVRRISGAEEMEVIWCEEDGEEDKVRRMAGAILPVCS